MFIMKKVFIKYNPYRVTTEILIDGKKIKNNSQLNRPDQRLQEWVDHLPEILCEECGTRKFEIEFQGTTLDYEDVLAVAQEAKKQDIEISVKHIPAKEAKDKEKVIDGIFEEIKRGPFEEFRDPDLDRAFRLAKSSDFEVNVVATMSAGKSTLINSLLGQKLMPARQEACTATITEIKDNDEESFNAQVFDKDGNQIEQQFNLTYAMMERLNANPDVARIHIEGDIPFVKAKDDVALVLVDTPGPNNARDPEHRAATFRMLSESSKTLVLYIMNATQLAVDDDNNLLSHVAESMKVGGKQSRDRFIFVLNKLDDFKKGEDSVESAIKKVREYLADNGIENPNIYPASALTALNIRTILAQSNDEDEDEVYDAKGKVRKFNRNEEMHFEKYAPLSGSSKKIVENRLADAISEENTNEQALIHSGIVPIEEAIKMYVVKYAKTAKIKNIVDTFLKKLESAQSFENTKKEIASKKEERDAIIAQINRIEAKLQSGEEAKKFKDQIAAINYDKEMVRVANDVIKKAQEKITEQLSPSKKCHESGELGVKWWNAHFKNEENDKNELSKDGAKIVIRDFIDFTKDLQAEVKVELENLISNNIQKSAEDLLDQYKRKLADLVEDIDVGDMVLNPFEMMEGEILDKKAVDGLVSSLKKTKRVKTGKEWIVNTDKKWWKFWTWLDADGHWSYKYEDRDYIDREELAQKFFAPVQENLYENSAAAQEYAKEATKRIKMDFAGKFDELDEILKEKLNELKECASDEKEAQKKMEEAQRRLNWLNDIQKKVDAILEI